MRVICDAPGQTCNRLWTYVTSVAQCIAEHRRMVIIFYDWTIEDFPNLLHCKFIFYPLYHKWFLNLPKGWGWYKHLTWKVTHNKVWDKIFHFLGFKKGWHADALGYAALLAKNLNTKALIRLVFFSPKAFVSNKTKTERNPLFESECARYIVKDEILPKWNYLVKCN